MEKIDFTKLKPVNYNRKSSESEDKQMLSIDSQVDEGVRITEYYKLPPFVEIFKESKSAKNEGVRDEFSRMMNMIRRGDVDSIVCWKADRLARNMSEGGMIIDMLSSGVIKAIITHDKVFYPWDNTIVLSVEFSQGKQFVKELSVNVKRGQEKKARMGYPHGMAALGFVNDKTEEKGNRKWVVDEERFLIIKEMFAMFLSGNYSGGKLYKWAVDIAKLTTPKHKRSGGCFVSYSRIYEILKDPIYAGFFYNNGQRYQLATDLPRIISESEHLLICKMLGDKRSPKTQEHVTAFAGFIKSPYGDFVGPDVKMQIICDCKYKFSYVNKSDCPKCSKLLGEMENPKYLNYNYYYNVKRKKQFQKIRSIEESKVNEYLTQYIQENLQLSDPLIDWCRKHISETQDKDIMNAVLIENARNAHLEQLAARRERSRQYLNDGITTPEDYKKDVEKIDREIKEMNNKPAQKSWSIRANEIISLSQSFVKILNSKDINLKREVLSRFGSNLVWDEEKLSIINTKEVQVLIDGLKEAKQKNSQFEPKNTLAGKDKTEVFASVCPIMLPRQGSNLRPID